MTPRVGQQCGLARVQPGPWDAWVMWCLVLAVIPAVLAGEANLAGAARPVRIYAGWLDPREHPDYERRAVKPPSWDTFDRRTRFTCLRGFNLQDDLIVGFKEELDRFTRAHELGDVIWPSYPILFARNLGELAAEIQRRGLYLFDIWGYVPGSGPGGYWQQFRVPPEALATLESTLGERWLGTDIGEQDGRYIGGYATQMTPASADRLDQYLNFQQHFERMGDDLGHKHATLVSLNFGHYLLKEGTYTLIGAETAQALPNNQVYYAFIRGAGKQCGVPWFGNASIYNRWGYKVYGSSGRGDGYDYGPTKGSSLSLLKRLLYSHILYNSVAVGYENMWFDGAQLSPIGRIQQFAQRWVKTHGSPGTLLTPVALLLDFHAGWTFPRHLYTDKVYRVWGNLPYDDGDFLTHGVLDVLYPGYADSSYFHDETGFITATPYGDIADALLSDVPLWLLQRYALVIVTSQLRGGRELRDKLQAYLDSGGQLLITRGNLDRLPGGLQTQSGRGSLTLMGEGFGLAPNPTPPPPIRSQVDQPLLNPHPLTADARQRVEESLRGVQTFELDPRLAWITCRRSPGQYTLGVFNNTWRPLPLRMVSRIGPIQSIAEWPIDASEAGAAGQTPEGVDPAALGRSEAGTIAGGDVRVFAVSVQEDRIEEVTHRRPPPRPHGRILPLRHPRTLKTEILARPTFFEHFDGVCLDWRYLHDREPATLATEAAWVRRQGLKVWVDLSSGVNLYPTLRWLPNSAPEYAASRAAVTNVLSKMERMGAEHLMLSLHRHPENNYSDEQSRQGFETTLRELAAEAAGRRVTLYLRTAFGKPPWNLDEAAQLLERVGADNLRLAPSTALLLADGRTQVPDALKPKVGVWLVAAPGRDLAGQLWDAHAPIHRLADLKPVIELLRSVPDAPALLDGGLAGADDEYEEAVATTIE